MPNPPEVIKAYLALREKKKALVEAQKKELLALDTAMEGCEKFLFATMKARGEDNIKVDGVGTAYISTTKYVKMDDREALIAYVRSTGNFNFFTNAVSKEAVLEYLDRAQQLPPGVSMTAVEEAHVRKA